jgi:hypothetical protein
VKMAIEAETGLIDASLVEQYMRQKQMLEREEAARAAAAARPRAPYPRSVRPYGAGRPDDSRRTPSRYDARTPRSRDGGAGPAPGGR